ncbi:hypothetical protein GCM10012284_49350 [Mangrovihabitans endophyticus]|uniref:Uncharacterized protein n=1 Tax=Mangrovihabitans endophyticus TaxID=1751298 RepID=A0A8J3C4X1_9ACTN|nr:hypothetical protein GCM10012284_49350 [Mangrovihabitans endophyticus]
MVWVAPWFDGAAIRRNSPGPYRVEWTIDEDLAWARTSALRASPDERVRNEGQDLLLRGRLNLATDNTPSLELGGAVILLDWAAPPPLDVSGAWIELRTHRDRAALYPC